MKSKSTCEKVSFDYHIREINKKHKQRLGFIGPYIGMLMILLFAIMLLPLFLYLVIFNRLYFWIRRQKNINSKPYFNYDRHNIPKLRFADKIWCEYCEWANGSLQWALAITNEIERRYCPVKNHCHPHCEKAKEWRDEFLNYEHSADQVGKYYSEQYLQESKPENK